jgi:hypothetical protein
LTNELSKAFDLWFPAWSLYRAEFGDCLRRGALADFPAPIWTDPDGTLMLSRSGEGSHSYRLRFADQISVDICWDDRVVSEFPLSGDVPKSTRDHFLVDQVMPRLLSQRNQLVLHSGAVCVDDKVLLFLGRSGSGKSTLVTSFRQGGYTLMGDDAVILSNDGRLPVARAIYPSLRLFPDSIEALFTVTPSLQAMAHYSCKQRIDVIGEQEAGPMPIQAIFVLGDDEPIAVRPLSTRQACMAIVENSFALDPTDPERAQFRLERASALARQVPVLEISYPRDYGRLPEVREAVIAALTAESALAG